MPLGEYFLNVFDQPAAGRDDTLLESALVGRTDGTLPCTLWVARVALLRLAHTIPSSVTLSFAPGAMLIVQDTLTIGGPLDAGLEPRFVLLGAGFVDLVGPLDEIVADWWHSSGGGSSVERALEALWGRYQHVGLLPAPIQLGGPYALERTLRIVPPAGTGAVEVILWGQHARPSDPPTFTRADGSGPMISLVSVEDTVLLTMEHVAFDLGAWPDTAKDAPSSGVGACLSVEGEDYGGTRIEACAFRFDAVAILVKPSLHRWQSRVTDTGLTREGAERLALGDAIRLSVSRPARLSLSRCLFTGTSAEACAVFTDLGVPAALGIRDCQFEGRYANAVSVLGGDVDVVGCQFASSLSPAGRGAADIIARSWDEGININAVGDKFNGVLPVKFERNEPRGENVYRGIPLANAHLTITHCISTSVNFLILMPAFRYSDTIPGGAMLTSVRHCPSGGGTALHVGPGAPQRSVVLQGCRFGSSVTVDYSTRGWVIVDLGTVFPLPGTGFLSGSGGIGPAVTLSEIL
jgi:hypothetical protein